MNPERILIAAEAVGIGRVAIARAARYARERIVFGRPIGQNQAIQHPLAQRWSELEAANLMMLKAASPLRPGARTAARRRMPRNISRAKPGSMPARPRS